MAKLTAPILIAVAIGLLLPETGLAAMQPGGMGPGAPGPIGPGGG